MLLLRRERQRSGYQSFLEELNVHRLRGQLHALKRRAWTREEVARRRQSASRSCHGLHKPLSHLSL